MRQTPSLGLAPEPHRGDAETPRQSVQVDEFMIHALVLVEAMVWKWSPAGRSLVVLWLVQV